MLPSPPGTAAEPRTMQCRCSYVDTAPGKACGSMVRWIVPPRDIAATLMRFLEGATLLGELAGPMWSTHYWRAIHDQLGIGFTKLRSERRSSYKQNPCSYCGVCGRRYRGYQGCVGLKRRFWSRLT